MLDILVVDDDDIVRESVCSALTGAGHRVQSAPDGERALSLIRGATFDVAVCDVHLPGIDGLTLLRRLRRDAPGTDVIMMTAFGSVPDAVATVRSGAEYVTKPFDPDDLAREVIGPIADRRAFRRNAEVTHAARALSAGQQAKSNVVCGSVVMRRLLERLESVARTDADVLLVGEAGSGKNLLARTLHALSARRSGPLVVVSGPALLTLDGPGEGALRLAEGGTLVLDGIDGLSPAAQGHLLRALAAQASRERARGSSERGARLVSLSRTDLGDAVDAGRFEVPLFFRLAGMELVIPPLRERAGDLYALVCHLLGELSPPGRATPDLTPSAWRALHDYPFPGNVRELRWALERALSASGGRTLGIEHLPAEVAGPLA